MNLPGADCYSWGVVTHESFRSRNIGDLDNNRRDFVVPLAQSAPIILEMVVHLCFARTHRFAIARHLSVERRSLRGEIAIFECRARDRQFIAPRISLCMVHGPEQMRLLPYLSIEIVARFRIMVGRRHGMAGEFVTSMNGGGTMSGTMRHIMWCLNNIGGDEWTLTGSARWSRQPTLSFVCARANRLVFATGIVTSTALLCNRLINFGTIASTDVSKLRAYAARRHTSSAPAKASSAPADASPETVTASEEEVRASEERVAASAARPRAYSSTPNAWAEARRASVATGFACTPNDAAHVRICRVSAAGAGASALTVRIYVVAQLAHVIAIRSYVSAWHACAATLAHGWRGRAFTRARFTHERHVRTPLVRPAPVLWNRPAHCRQSVALPSRGRVFVGPVLRTTSYAAKAPREASMPRSHDRRIPVRSYA